MNIRALLPSVILIGYAGGGLASASCARKGDPAVAAEHTVRLTPVPTSVAQLPPGLTRIRASEQLGCAPGETTFCITDTAYGVADTGNPAGLPRSSWISFSVLGDSVELNTIPPGYVHAMIGVGPDSLRNRLSDGVRLIDVAFDPRSTDTIVYTLRMRWLSRDVPSPLRPTGRTALLDLQSNYIGTRFSVVPLSRASAVRDRVRWTVPRGVHKVVLVADSLYEVCRIPCSLPDSVKLLPGTRASARE